MFHACYLRLKHSTRFQQGGWLISLCENLNKLNKELINKPRPLKEQKNVPSRNRARFPPAHQRISLPTGGRSSESRCSPIGRQKTKRHRQGGARRGVFFLKIKELMMGTMPCSLKKAHPKNMYMFRPGTNACSHL